MATSKFFSTKRIDDNTLMIYGLARENCYLVMGEQRALLIDTLTGAGNLRAFVREITDLPVFVVNTHGHLDHAGGNFDFESCFIHPSDINMVFSGIKGDNRMSFVRNSVVERGEKDFLAQEDFAPIKPLITRPIYDGDVFDLGGRCIRTIAVPGHTQGSLVFLDEESGDCFIGDACNSNTLLLLDDSTSIEEYLEGLKHFEGFIGKVKNMYNGHEQRPIAPSALYEGIELCGEIIARTDDAIAVEFLGRTGLLAKKRSAGLVRADGKYMNIVYSEEKILRQEKSCLIRW